MGEVRRRARQGVAAVGAQRLAAPEARRQGAGRDPQDARQALRQHGRQRERARRHRRVHQLHQRLHRFDRPAHRLFRPAQRGALQPVHVAVARGHRRAAAEAGRRGGDPRGAARRPGDQERPARGRRPHRRRRPGRQRADGGRGRLAHRRRGRQDQGTQGHQGAPGHHPARGRHGQQAPARGAGARQDPPDRAGRQVEDPRGAGARRPAGAAHRRDRAARLLPGLRRPPQQQGRLRVRHP